MHLLLALFKYFPYGGLQKDTLRFAEEAVRQGHQATILTTAWEGERPEGIHILMCKCTGFSNHAKMQKFEMRFKGELATGKYDVSLAMSRIPGADFYFVADTCMAEWMPQKHSKLALTLFPRYRTYLRQEAEICAPDSKTVLFYIAEAQKKAFKKIYNLPDDRFAYLPPGMDSRCIRPANALEIRRAKRSELGLNEEQIALILVGTNLWRKGADRVMESMAHVTDKRLVFFIAGADKQENVDKLAAKYGVAAQVRFLGPRKDINQLLLAADLMVHPAREEGTGTVLVEALAAGCPVICTEECGFSNFVQDATRTVIPSEFSQKALDAMLAKSIENLPELTEQTIDYAKTQDFTARSRVAIERMCRL